MQQVAKAEMRAFGLKEKHVKSVSYSEGQMPAAVADIIDPCKAFIAGPRSANLSFRLLFETSPRHQGLTVQQQHPW